MKYVPSCLWAKKTHVGWADKWPEEPLPGYNVSRLTFLRTPDMSEVDISGQNLAYQVRMICLSATWRSRRWRGRWWCCYSQRGWQTAWPGDIFLAIFAASKVPGDLRNISIYGRGEPRPWCFREPYQVVFVPQPKQSISRALWRERNLKLQHKESFNLPVDLQTGT